MENFYQEIYKLHKNSTIYPSYSILKETMEDLLRFLFPQRSKTRLLSVLDCKEKFKSIKKSWYDIFLDLKQENAEKVLEQFTNKIPHIFEELKKDAQAMELGDPAASSQDEVIRCYPGFYAIYFHRVSHILYKLNLKTLARDLSEIAHKKTGIDIHPAASIGSFFCIDHGTGIVVGESCTIGEWVKLYQGVTLGALSVNKTLTTIKRHPTIGNNVVIYAGATILGGNTIIGNNSIIGGNVWLTKSVEENSRVYHTASLKILKNKDE